MEVVRPMVVGIDDKCDSCGGKGVVGICFGPRRPCICEGCFAEAWTALERWRRKVDGSAIVRVADASEKR